MTESNNKHRQSDFEESLRRFVDAGMRGEKLDIEEFVDQFPEFENLIRQKVHCFNKIDGLFDTLLQSGQDEFGDMATGTDLIGRMVGSFEINEMIGRGGMGVVYLARDTKLDRSVAIKSIPAELHASSNTRMRLKREARLLASLDHPNIGVIHDIIEQDEGFDYLILEYVPGETLAKRISGEPLELEEALSIACQVAEAVSAAHEKGVTHRDIKPGNIKITPDSRVKVLDFGLAKVFSEQQIEQDNTVTQPGRVIGTPAYMSPEQTRGKSTDYRTDIWSFGCVLYEMLTGQIPFKGDTTSDTLAKVLEHDPDWQALPHTIPEDIIQLLQRCLEKDPERRFQSAQELSRELQNCQIALTTPSPKAIDLHALLRLLRRPEIALGVLLILMMISVSVCWLFNRMTKVKLARESIPEIERLIEQNKYFDAFTLAQKAEKYIAKDPILIELWPRITRDLSITATPSSADVFYKEYSNIEGEWLFLGQSPLEKIKFPRGRYRWKIEKEGFICREFLAGGSFETDLWEEDNHPVNMVLVPPGYARMYRDIFFGNEDPVNIPEFWIDKFEVTNKQFKAFIDNGGYEKQEYWKHTFIQDSSEVSWKEAMDSFKDTTGRPGPSTWKGGLYPEGQEGHPVCGVSWYEAAAYADFMKKSLPTLYHWQKAACIGEQEFILPFSNFGTEGPAPVGSHTGIGYTGLYDMAGNAKEWCFNATDDLGNSRCILGGAWNESTTRFVARDSLPSWDRSANNGFRCVSYPEGRESEIAILSRPDEFIGDRDYSKEKPISDDEFEIYKQLYAYDPTELNAVVESVDESSIYCRKERITFDAAYGGGDERVVADLFLPKGVEPPYQTVIYFPGGGAIQKPYRSFKNRNPFLVMSG